jgi:hypothetical protein
MYNANCDGSGPCSPGQVRLCLRAAAVTRYYAMRASCERFCGDSRGIESWERRNSSILLRGLSVKCTERM